VDCSRYRLIISVNIPKSRCPLPQQLFKNGKNCCGSRLKLLSTEQQFIAKNPNISAACQNKKIKNNQYFLQDISNDIIKILKSPDTKKLGFLSHNLCMMRRENLETQLELFIFFKPIFKFKKILTISLLYFP
jgi:hypothetical protein